MKRVLFVAAFTLSLLPRHAAAQTADTASPPVVPRLVNLSGQLVTPAGAPRTGTVLLTFGIYADQTGGAPLWSEQQAVTLDAKGQYAVFLGSITTGGLPNDVFVANTARWLGIRVESEAEQPRIMMVSVPYALKAA